MSKVAAKYPTSVWDVSSPARAADATIDRGPEFRDWDQMVAEMVAVQTELDAIRFFSAPNSAAATVAPGCPLYLKADGSGWAKADANGAAPLYDVVGLAVDGDASVGHNGTIKTQKAGLLTLTTGQWDTVTGGSGGLTPNVEYYLSGTVGQITATRPGTTGDHVKRVGIAVSATVMNIDVKHQVIAP